MTIDPSFFIEGDIVNNSLLFDEQFRGLSENGRMCSNNDSWVVVQNPNHCMKVISNSRRCYQG